MQTYIYACTCTCKLERKQVPSSCYDRPSDRILSFTITMVAPLSKWHYGVATRRHTYTNRYKIGTKAGAFVLL